MPVGPVLERGGHKQHAGCFSCKNVIPVASPWVLGCKCDLRIDPRYRDAKRQETPLLLLPAATEDHTATRFFHDGTWLPCYGKELIKQSEAPSGASVHSKLPGSCQRALTGINGIKYTWGMSIHAH